MRSERYEYGTTPRKIETEYKRSNKKDIERQTKINERQKKEALKLEKKKHNKNVAFVVAIFLILLIISYRSSLINESFNEMQLAKQELSAIEKTNGQLEVSIETGLNLSNIEQSAKDKLGMQKLDNGQKVYITLDKKDYVEGASEEVDIEGKTEESWYKKIINKILGK